MDSQRYYVLIQESLHPQNPAEWGMIFLARCADSNLGFTREMSKALTVSDLPSGNQLVREYRNTYGEHANLVVVSEAVAKAPQRERDKFLPHWAWLHKYS